MTTTGARLTWSLLGRDRAEIEVRTDWAGAGGAEWAWGGADGRGVRVCVLDSGVDVGHPAVGPVASSHTVRDAVGGGVEVVGTEGGDSCGHGTACASIIRLMAPE